MHQQPPKIPLLRSTSASKSCHVVSSRALTVYAGAGTGAVWQQAGPVGTLQFGDDSGWWYPRDYLHEVTTSADGRMQTTVPVRSGQRQGYMIDIYNPTNVTQTILGPGNTPDSPALDPVRIGVSVPNRNIDRGASTWNIRFTLPGAIPPHQTREVRVLWTSTACLAKGSAEGIDQISFRVRVGWLTRTEVIPLDQGWYLSGPSQGPCT